MLRGPSSCDPKLFADGAVRAVGRDDRGARQRLGLAGRVVHDLDRSVVGVRLGAAHDPLERVAEADVDEAGGAGGVEEDRLREAPATT